MLPRRVTAAVTGAAVLAAAVWFGWLDTARIVDLLTGRVITDTSAFAMVALLCWLAVAGIVGAVVARLLGRRGGRRRSIRRAPLALVAGATLLGLGVVHHNAGYGVCCANAGTAQQAEHRVR
jgi:high-affinity Fe2+/Pb2+ permease